MSLPSKPTPPDNDLSRPFWAAAAQGRLVLQTCAACGKRRHYPRLLCDHCYSDAVVWLPATGRGSLHSWTVAHHAFHPAFADDLPYTLVTVDLDEGVRALGRWRGDALLCIGLAVQGGFETGADGALSLIFEPRHMITAAGPQA